MKEKTRSFRRLGQPDRNWMKPGKLTHTVAVVLSSITSLFTHSAPAKVPTAKMKVSKKSDRSQDDSFPVVDTLAYLSPARHDPPKRAERFPWKKEIVTTVFWIGEQPTANNPVPNRASSWDKNWTHSYGGVGNPYRAHPAGYISADFTPPPKPVFFALPFNDKDFSGHPPEAIPGCSW